MYRDLDRQRPKPHEVKPAGSTGGLYYFRALLFCYRLGAYSPEMSLPV
jgi:hypothetical protein